MRMNIKAQNCNSHYKTKNTGATFIIIQMRHKKKYPEQSLGTIPDN